MKRVAKVAEQLGLDLRKSRRGGPQPGSGRPRKPDAIRHDARPELSRHTPVHVSLRVHRDVGRLRRRDGYRAVRGAVATCLGRRDFRIIHLSIQRNHIHSIVEAHDKYALANGLRAFMISATRRLNGPLGRRGTVFTQRYHAVQIKTPIQARAALAYVLNNWRRHGEDAAGSSLHHAYIDPFSTGILFDGWDTTYKFDTPTWYEPMSVHAPRSWLLTVGWRKHPRIGLDEVPGPLRIPRPH
jgi:REP element-mobilizing transposase RayT